MSYSELLKLPCAALLKAARIENGKLESEIQRLEDEKRRLLFELQKQKELHAHKDKRISRLTARLRVRASWFPEDTELSNPTTPAGTGGANP